MALGAAGELLGAALAENTGMKSLSLAWNCIRGRGGVALARGLGVNMTSLSCSLGIDPSSVSEHQGYFGLVLSAALCAFGIKSVEHQSKLR